MLFEKQILRKIQNQAEKRFREKKKKTRVSFTDDLHACNFIDQRQKWGKQTNVCMTHPKIKEGRSRTETRLLEKKGNYNELLMSSLQDSFFFGQFFQREMMLILNSLASFDSESKTHVDGNGRGEWQRMAEQQHR